MINYDDVVQTRGREKRRTKIVATIGPKSRSPEKIRGLIKAGVNVFRLNFSHGSHTDHGEVVETIRNVADELKSTVAILQDLAGPKIRISAVESDTVDLLDNQEVMLVRSEGQLSTAQTIYVETLDPVEFLQAGHPVLLSDGIISLEVIENEGSHVRAKIIKGGQLRSRVGIAFPDSTIDIPATTEKDLVDLRWGIEKGIDFVAVSFVKDGSDIKRVRQELQKHGGDQHIIAKIERKDSLVNLNEILAGSDGLMVARGDLGLELPLEFLPTIQKEIIEQCNFAGVPVIVATQMLSSMVTSIRPTRAEVSDVATAVMQGADAVMLSEETAIGAHPEECVAYLDRIAVEAEKGFEFDEYKLRMRGADMETVADSVAYAACAAAVKVNAAALIACTASGRSARLLAKYRPQQPLYGSSSKPATLRRMNLYWGITGVSTARASNHHEELEIAISAVKEQEQLPSGSRAVITGGLIVGKPGATTVLEIREMK